MDLEAQEIESNLETIASSIVASDLSLELLNNLEDTEDRIREITEGQRVDRTIRIFDLEGHLLFRNQMARALDLQVSNTQWATSEYQGRKLKTLTVQNDSFVIEVGVFLDPVLTGFNSHLKLLFALVFGVVMLSALISYVISGITMRPLKSLGQTFSLIKSRGMAFRDSDSVFTENDAKVFEEFQSEKGEIGVLARDLVSVLKHWKDIHHEKRKDLAFLAHELKTPLAKIIFETEALASAPGDSSQALTTSVSRIRKECLAMSDFIGEYINLVAVRAADPYRQALSAVKLGELLIRVRDEKFSHCAERIQIANLSSQTIFADRLHLESVVSNLIGNAAKYSSGTIEVSWQDGQLEICDSGPGLSESVMARLGEAFNRSDDRSSTGLGLALVMGICRLYQWEFGYFRRPGSGGQMMSVFRIDFGADTA